MLYTHQRVQKDVRDALVYYREHAERSVADRFYEELSANINHAITHPEEAHVATDAPGYRRKNLKNFPYHFLYKPYKDSIYVLVVRHDKRHPSFGLRRKTP